GRTPEAPTRPFHRCAAVRGVPRPARDRQSETPSHHPSGPSQARIARVSTVNQASLQVFPKRDGHTAAGERPRGRTIGDRPKRHHFAATNQPRWRGYPKKCKPFRPTPLRRRLSWRTCQKTFMVITSTSTSKTPTKFGRQTCETPWSSGSM